MDRDEIVRKKWRSMLQNSLPADMAVAEDQVMKAEDQWSQKSRLRVTSFKPQRMQKEDECVKLECRATAVGDLASIARFLYEMEKDPLPLKLEEIELTAQDEHGEKLMLGVRFSGLRLNEQKSNLEGKEKSSS